MRRDTPYSGIAEGPGPSPEDVLKAGLGLARFGGDVACRQLTDGFLNRVPVQRRMRIATTPEPELVVDAYPHLTGGAC